ncbi:MAG: hypothetical protein K2O89_06980 [Clostridia bacterium]|nr:hypothetical protein [Clostridia bacterium]
MFGYINPDSPYLFKKDETLYKALYCGLCKSIGVGCGQTARSALTYDMAFTSALVHNIRGEDVKIEKRRCAIHWLRRRPIAAVDETTVALGCVNTVLAYYKLCDDKADGEKRGVLRHLYKSGFKRAVKRFPQIKEIVSRETLRQSELEKAGCAVVDEAADPTAQMMQDISSCILGEYSTPYTQKLFYALGKWVYLADALDDYDKDVKKGRYNALYGSCKIANKKAAIEKCGEEWKFIFNSMFADMRESLANIKFYFNHDLTDNIVLRGIPLKTRSLFYGKGCKGENNEQEKP